MRKAIRSFPSPCGVLVLKFIAKKTGINIDPAFPSPCGVLVLKSAHPQLAETGEGVCFRPLAGFWFLNH